MVSFCVLHYLVLEITNLAMILFRKIEFEAVTTEIAGVKLNTKKFPPATEYRLWKVSSIKTPN